jgi:hypothetical protein
MHDGVQFIAAEKKKTNLKFCAIFMQEIKSKRRKIILQTS